jgi:hypothetical protein
VVHAAGIGMSLVSTALEGGVLTATLNRVDRGNALDAALVADLRAAVAFRSPTPRLPPHWPPSMRPTRRPRSRTRRTAMSSPHT